MKAINKERDKIIIKKYINGETTTSLAKEFGITSTRICQILNSAGQEKRVREYPKNRFVVEGDKVILYAKCGTKIIIDLEDFERVRKHSWCVSPTDRVVSNIKGKTTYLHRFILGVSGGIIDHINGNNKDNRKCNLRLVTCLENARNNISKSKYGVNGVRLLQSGKYNVRITVNYKNLFIGNFDTLEKAIQARINAEKKYFGEYAPTSRYNIEQPRVEVEIKNYGND